jgi:hypothetical protein
VNGDGSHASEVAAPYLQLVMFRLWETELSMGSRRLCLDTLGQLGGAQTIIGTYVDRALGGLPDDDRELAVGIFRYLVTPSGTKIALTASDLAEYADRPVNEVIALLERLASTDTRILRTIVPPRGRAGEKLFEISHDLLAPAIQDWSRRRMAVQLEHEKAAAELEARTAKQEARTEGKRARRSGKINIGVVAAIILLIIILIYVGSA